MAPRLGGLGGGSVVTGDLGGHFNGALARRLVSEVNHHALIRQSPRNRELFVPQHCVQTHFDKGT